MSHWTHAPLLIVVPTLNSYTLLPRLLASLQQQSWPHWRLLFIDGPSGPQHRDWLQQCCDRETRCQWVIQDSSEPGIFGAMNQGFAFAADRTCIIDWLLFWGSDDWAASRTVLAEAMEAILSLRDCPDLLICKGRYFNVAANSMGRSTMFRPAGLIASTAYRRSLLLGSTPPHQATFFGIGARQLLSRYSPCFRLSADLDYFLRLSRYSGLQVKCLDLELVHMADGGISGQQTQKRLREVRLAYRRAFGLYWWFPFLARYVRRIASLLKVSP